MNVSLLNKVLLEMMEMNVLSCVLQNVMELKKCNVMEEEILTVVCNLNFAGHTKEVLQQYELKNNLTQSLWGHLLSGPVGNDGYECPFHCPTKCDADYMQCPEGEDGNGCRMPDTCMPMKGGSSYFR